jgi:hypothetical protein
MALQAEFHKFIALALGVGDWKIGFGLSIGGTDDGGGLVYTALKLACFFVSDQVSLVGGNGMLPL